MIWGNTFICKQNIKPNMLSEIGYAVNTAYYMHTDYKSMLFYKSWKNLRCEQRPFLGGRLMAHYFPLFSVSYTFSSQSL